MRAARGQRCSRAGRRVRRQAGVEAQPRRPTARHAFSFTIPISVPIPIPIPSRPVIDDISRSGPRRPVDRITRLDNTKTKELLKWETSSRDPSHMPSRSLHSLTTPTITWVRLPDGGGSWRMRRRSHQRPQKMKKSANGGIPPYLPRDCGAAPWAAFKNDFE